MELSKNQNHWRLILCLKELTDISNRAAIVVLAITSNSKGQAKRT
jgi:hypothetical protein